MKFTVGRLDVVAVQTLAPPLFGLPTRAPELFEALYGQLNEQFPMRPADLQITGGTTYSDLKITMKSGDKVHADIGANGFYVQMLDVKEREHFKKFVTVYEETLQALFPRVAFVDSVVRLHGWLVCDGPADAVPTILRQRGESAFSSTSFDDFSKDYTFRIEMKKLDDTYSATLLLQRSALPVGQLYAEANFQFNKGYEEKRLSPQVEKAIEHSLLMLRDAGFEGAKE
jgi:hypothetical protein